MSEDNQEITGFYRDSVTGKYHTDRSGVSSSPSLKELKSEKCNKEFKITPKVTNVVRYLNAREIRAIGGIQESKEYLKMRWYLKQTVQITEIEQLSNYIGSPSVDTHYITGSDDSVYGFWYDEKLDMNLVGTVKFKEHFAYDSYFHTAQSHVIDMCEGFTDDFIVVYRTPYSHYIFAERFDVYDEGGCMIYLLQSLSSRNSKQHDRQIFCCCCNKRKLYHAFGTENSVIFINDFDRTSFKIEGQIHTISFDDTGELMVLGMNSGNLILYDLRGNNIVMNVEVSKSCLIDSSVINSNHIITAGINNILCKVDIRKKEIVTEFLAHKQQSMKKAPFSIANNMLCAAGSDNRIRIWGLSGGLPLHEIKPDDPQKNIRGWLCEIGNKPNLYCYEGIHQKLFKIM